MQKEPIELLPVDLADEANRLVDEIRAYLRDNAVLRSKMNTSFRISESNYFGWHLLGDDHKTWSDMIASTIPYLMTQGGDEETVVLTKRLHLARIGSDLSHQHKWLLAHTNLVDELIKARHPKEEVGRRDKTDCGPLCDTQL